MVWTQERLKTYFAEGSDVIFYLEDGRNVRGIFSECDEEMITVTTYSGDTVFHNIIPIVDISFGALIKKFIDIEKELLDETDNFEGDCT